MNALAENLPRFFSNLPPAVVAAKDAGIAGAVSILGINLTGTATGSGVVALAIVAVSAIFGALPGIIRAWTERNSTERTDEDKAHRDIIKEMVEQQARERESWDRQQERNSKELAELSRQLQVAREAETIIRASKHAMSSEIMGLWYVAKEMHEIMFAAGMNPPTFNAPNLKEILAIEDRSMKIAVSKSEPDQK